MSKQDERICGGCNTLKPILDFGVNSARKGGLCKYCKECLNKYNRKKYQENREIRIIKNELYRQNHLEAWQKANNLRNITVYRELNKARHAVAQALKKGYITKQPCLECEETKTDFHHTDGYDKENYLVGIWLCRTHHAALHVRLREERRNG